MTNNATFLLVDDHPLFRQGLMQTLSTIDWIGDIETANNGREALEKVPHLRPDFVILDIEMPEMDGITCLKALRQTAHELKIILMTNYDDQAYILAAMTAGANAFLLKDSEPDEIITCLGMVRQGKQYFCTLSSSNTLLPSVEDSDSLVLQQLAQLTDIEKRVIKAVADFKTSKEIGKLLELNYRTVQNHRSRICKKLNLTGRYQLVEFARTHFEYIRKL